MCLSSKATTELIEETYQRRINPSRRKFQKDQRDHEKWKRIMLEVLERYHSTGQKYSFDVSRCPWLRSFVGSGSVLALDIVLLYVNDNSRNCRNDGRLMPRLALPWHKLKEPWVGWAKNVFECWKLIDTILPANNCSFKQIVGATQTTKRQDLCVAAENIFNQCQTRFVAMQLFISYKTIVLLLLDGAYYWGTQPFLFV